MTTFLEITNDSHDHGGRGWELGTCLWSPTLNRSGADRYSLMREPKSGDRVLHIYRHLRGGVLGTWLVGSSVVAEEVRTVATEPPSAGAWAGESSYYRIELKAYEAFEAPVAIPTLLADYGDLIRDDLRTNRPRFYPFNSHGADLRTVQGIYLARCTDALESIIRMALGIQEEIERGGVTAEPLHAEYAEARRMARERYFFARNAELARASKRLKGYCCEACGFDFVERYGEIGRDFAEAHHLLPLSERPESAWTDALKSTVEDIAVLCANCHRMVHRRSPALSLSELRACIRILSE